METRSGNLQIYFEVAGDGPPIMLVHGWGADGATNWVSTGWVEHLSRERTVILMDVRGHGRSAKPHRREAYTYGAMCPDVLAVMDALGVERCDFLGYSMGAFMGAWLLGNHSERFGRMVLGGIGEETEDSAAQGAVIAKILRSELTDHPVRKFVEAVPGHDLEALACSAEAMWPDGSPSRLVRSGRTIGSNPVLVVNGSLDRPYVDSADQLVDLLPNARHERLAGADHLSAVTEPAFKQLVAAFLAHPKPAT